MDLTEHQQQYLDGLIELHKFLSERPALIPEAPIIVDNFVWDEDQFAPKVKALGSAEKKNTSDYYYLRRNIGIHKVEVTIRREKVCERVQVGTKEVTHTIYPENVQTTTITEEVPVYEWKCPDSILGGS
jgi:hypothetical protein